MNMKGLLIDDDSNAQEAAKRFTSPDLSFEFREPAPLEAFAASIIAAEPSIVVVDYRLDEHRTSHGLTARYKASALAQQLRDMAGENEGADFPIVLHSAENNIKRLFKPEKTAHDLFDFVISKSARKKDGLEVDLADLARGYATLNASRPFNLRLREIFGVSEENHSLIDMQEIHQAATTEIPHILARFILQRLIRHSGVLTDIETLFARAGVRISDDDSRQVLLNSLAETSISYRGVFGVIHARWWSAPLDSWLYGLFGAPSSRLTATERARKLTEFFGTNVEPAVSTWSGSSDERFTLACAICKSPTHVGHSVSVLENSSGALADRRRICFDCIQNDRHIDRPELIIDALDQEVERSVRLGDITRN